jgi:exopolysaccharide biosynthesis polyprenyl glycosylphosphotransferase
LDLICVTISFLSAFWGYHYVKLGTFIDFDTYDGAYRIIIVLIFLTHLFYAFSGNIYSEVMHRTSVEEIRGIVWHNIKLLASILIVLFFLKESATYSRLILAIFFCLNVFLMSVCRTIRKKSLLKTKKATVRQSHMLIVAEKEHADALRSLLDPKAYSGYELVGCVDKDTYKDFIRENIIDEVFVSYPEGPVRSEIIETLVDMGLTVHIDIGQYLDEMPNSHISNLNDRSVISTAINPMTFRQKFIKRLIDIIGGILGLIITAILFIFFAPIILIQSPGHIIFKQKRVGKNGRIFDFYKFRSMYPDAEERKKALMDQNKMEGLMFKMDNDPRIFPFGRFLRKTSLDEFPQFWNVLKGDMSLVGTRPPTLDEYEKYSLYHASRLSIKPGITGLWQISGRSDITNFEEVVKLDREYIRNFSTFEDLRIMFKTITVVFTGKGSV